MNWLYAGIFMAFAFIAWFTFIITKRKYDRPLLIIGLAHIPFLLINLVAPFRNLFDEMYVGYVLGWINLPRGPLVTIVSGGILIGSLIIASRAMLNAMEKWWTFGFLFDLLLSVAVGFPVLWDVITDPVGSRIQLAEFLSISGIYVAILTFILFSGPMFLSTYYMGKHLVKKIWKTDASKTGFIHSQQN